MKRDSGPKFCVYQGAHHRGDARDEVRQQGPHHGRAEEPARRPQRRSSRRSNPEDAKLKCANVTADLLAETAMAWHLEAVGSGGVRGTDDKKTMALAAQLYENVVQTFKPEDFAKFEFPRIVKEDWPTIFKIKYAMADLLYFQKDWAKCGPAFDAVVAEDPDGPARRPRPRTRRCSATRTSTPSSTQGGSEKKGSGNLPDSGEEGRQARKSGKAKAARPQGLHRGPEGHDHGLQPLHLLHQARRRATRRRSTTTSRSSSRAAAPTSRPSTGRRRRSRSATWR